MTTALPFRKTAKPAENFDTDQIANIA